MFKGRVALFSDTNLKSTLSSLKDTSIFEFRTREEQLKQVYENPNYDILIIGGGATGAGALLSASRKGYRALLIDSNDFAAGTSSKSTKLLHGGLRYIENAFKLRNANRKEDFYLVNESLVERDMLLNNVPYMNDQVGMIIPVTNIFSAAFYYGGSWFYHMLARAQRYFKGGIASNSSWAEYPFQVEKPQLIFGKGLREMVPMLSKRYKYGVILFDGQCDDSSLVIDAILTATSMNDPSVRKNEAINYARLENFIKDGSGQIIGAKVVDKLAGKEFTVSFKAAINATGIFGDQIKKLANPDCEARLAFAKGDHITLMNENQEILPHGLKNIGVFIPKTSDGRVMFLLPWQNSIIAGTTDKVVSTPVIHPFADDASVREIITEIQPYFPGAKFEVISKWSGIRPLVKTLNSDSQSKSSLTTYHQTRQADTEAKEATQNPPTAGKEAPIGQAEEEVLETKDLKRIHAIDVDDKSGLVTVYGGKLTIFRRMGEDAVDEASKQMVNSGKITQAKFEEAKSKSTGNLRFIGDYRNKLSGQKPSQTEGVSIQQSFPDRKSYLNYLIDFIQVQYSSVDSDIAEYLTKRYGHRAITILDEMSKDQSSRLRLDPSYPYTKAELEHIIKNEFVAIPIDVLIRRMRIAFLDAAAAKKMLPHVIDIYGDLHQWDKNTKIREFKASMQILEKMDF